MELPPRSASWKTIDENNEQRQAFQTSGSNLAKSLDQFFNTQGHNNEINGFIRKGVVRRHAFSIAFDPTKGEKKVIFDNSNNQFDILLPPNQRGQGKNVELPLSKVTVDADLNIKIAMNVTGADPVIVKVYPNGITLKEDKPNTQEKAAVMFDGVMDISFAQNIFQMIKTGNVVMNTIPYAMYPTIKDNQSGIEKIKISEPVTYFTSSGKSKAPVNMELLKLTDDPKPHPVYIANGTKMMKVSTSKKPVISQKTVGGKLETFMTIYTGANDKKGVLIKATPQILKELCPVLEIDPKVISPDSPFMSGNTYNLNPSIISPSAILPGNPIKIKNFRNFENAPTPMPEPGITVDASQIINIINNIKGNVNITDNIINIIEHQNIQNNFASTISPNGPSGPNNPGPNNPPTGSNNPPNGPTGPNAPGPGANPQPGGPANPNPGTPGAPQPGVMPNPGGSAPQQPAGAGTGAGGTGGTGAQGAGNTSGTGTGTPFGQPASQPAATTATTATPGIPPAQSPTNRTKLMRDLATERAAAAEGIVDNGFKPKDWADGLKLGGSTLLLASCMASMVAAPLVAGALALFGGFSLMVGICPQLLEVLPFFKMKTPEFYKHKHRVKELGKLLEKQKLQEKLAEIALNPDKQRKADKLRKKIAKADKKLAKYRTSQYHEQGSAIDTPEQTNALGNRQVVDFENNILPLTDAEYTEMREFEDKMLQKETELLAEQELLNEDEANARLNKDPVLLAKIAMKQKLLQDKLTKTQKRIGLLYKDEAFTSRRAQEIINQREIDVERYANQASEEQVDSFDKGFDAKAANAAAKKAKKANATQLTDEELFQARVQQVAESHVSDVDPRFKAVVDELSNPTFISVTQARATYNNSILMTGDKLSRAIGPTLESIVGNSPQDLSPTTNDPLVGTLVNAIPAALVDLETEATSQEVTDTLKSNNDALITTTIAGLKVKQSMLAKTAKILQTQNDMLITQSREVEPVQYTTIKALQALDIDSVECGKNGVIKKTTLKPLETEINNTKQQIKVHADILDEKAQTDIVLARAFDCIYEKDSNGNFKRDNNGNRVFNNKANTQIKALLAGIKADPAKLTDEVKLKITNLEETVTVAYAASQTPGKDNKNAKQAELLTDKQRESLEQSKDAKQAEADKLRKLDMDLDSVLDENAKYSSVDEYNKKKKGFKKRLEQVIDIFKGKPKTADKRTSKEIKEEQGKTSKRGASQQTP